MALPTCNPWSANTAQASSQVAACKSHSAMAAQWELTDPNFLSFMIDALQRLAVAGVEGFQNLSEYVICDGEENNRNLHCAGQFFTPPVQFDPTEAKQIIAWQLANALCANDA